jgi:hypothetical protein
MVATFRSFLRGDVPLARALLLYGVFGWLLMGLVGVYWRATELHETVEPQIGFIVAWAILLLRSVYVIVSVMAIVRSAMRDDTWLKTVGIAVPTLYFFYFFWQFAITIG